MSKHNASGSLSTRKVRGKIESINSKNIRGWVYIDDGEIPIIEVVLNGTRLPSVSPTINRPQLQKKLGTSQNCGFVVELPGSDLLDRQKTNRIEITEMISGHQFGRESHAYCPLVRKQSSNLKSLFFSEFYRKNYGLENLSNDDSFKHYISTGIYLDYNPNPWFSSDYFKKHYAHKLKNIDLPILAYLNFEEKLDIKASEHFDPEYYSTNNSDIDIKGGLLNHYVNHGHLEGRNGHDTTLPDVISQETIQLSEIEPKLALYFKNNKAVLEYPTLSVSTYIPRLVRNRFGENIKIVICVPFLSCGGADLISTYILKAYQQIFEFDRVLFIVTDKSENAMPQWISEKSQIVYLDEEAKFTDFNERVFTLHSIIGLLSPDKVININSHACWEMYRSYGRQLASVIDLYAYLFCFDYTPENRISGYIVDYIPKTIRYLKKVFCDNQTIIDDMQQLYGFSEQNHDVLKSVYVPIPDGLNQLVFRSDGSQHKKKILWISRLARQKRPDILLKIADEMPDQSFVVYGPPGDSSVSSKIIKNEIHNIEYRGVFQNFADLDLNEYSLFLNTSAWDGLPTILIQIMGTGLPIVTSNAGGIHELVTDETGTLIIDDEDTFNYSVAIKSVLINYSNNLEKARSGLGVINDRHKWDVFLDRLTSIGAFEEISNSTRRIIQTKDRRRDYGS